MKEKILEILTDDCRTSHKTIGMMLGISEEEVNAIVAELEQENILLKYTAIVNWEKTAKPPMVRALISAKVRPQREVGFDAIARRICGFPEVKSLMLVSGASDLCMVIEGGSMLEVARFVSDKLATIDGVESTVTNFVLKDYKGNDVIFESDEGDRRQVVMP